MQLKILFKIFDLDLGEYEWNSIRFGSRHLKPGTWWHQLHFPCHEIYAEKQSCIYYEMLQCDSSDYDGDSLYWTASDSELSKYKSSDVELPIPTTSKKPVVWWDEY